MTIQKRPVVLKQQKTKKQKSDFYLDNYDYPLKRDQIADRPGQRGMSRLLVGHYCNGQIQLQDDHFYNLLNYLDKDTTLVLNQSKVFCNRIAARKSSGGAAEIFLLNNRRPFKALIKARGKKRVGDSFFFTAGSATIEKICSDHFQIKITGDIESILQTATVPIPPYLRRPADEQDKKDYQTVYAKNVGSVAAPTAGLHFSSEMMQEIKKKGIKIAYVTLHVGIGTFTPIQESDLRLHKMHQEQFFISKKNLQLIQNARKIIAVGTTSLRVLESMKSIKNFTANKHYRTSLFIYPPYQFYSKIKGVITNFHLPKSSLIVLIAALIGRENILKMYGHAIKNGYRFYSYGDATLILCS